MSFDATKWAWAAEVKPATRKLVLLALADRADEKGNCHPSTNCIAADTGLNRKTVLESLRTLEADGFITAEKRNGAVSLYALDLSNQYRNRDRYQKRYQYRNRTRTSTENGHGPVPKSVPESISEPISEPKRDSAANATPPRKRATQISAEFVPDSTALATAASLQVVISDELPKFIDYYTAHGKPMKDWQATFRNWLRNAAKWKQKTTRQDDAHEWGKQFNKFVNSPSPFDEGLRDDPKTIAATARRVG